MDSIPARPVDQGKSNVSKKKERRLVVKIVENKKEKVPDQPGLFKAGFFIRIVNRRTHMESMTGILLKVEGPVPSFVDVQKYEPLI